MEDLRLQQIKAAPPGVEPATTQTLLRADASRASIRFILRSCWLVAPVASISSRVEQCESSMSFLPTSPPCAMGGRFLRSMASADHWRQEDTNCKSLLLTSTGQE